MTFCRQFWASCHLSNRHRTGGEGFRHNEGRIPHNRFVLPSGFSFCSCPQAMISAVPKGQYPATFRS